MKKTIGKLVNTNESNHFADRMNIKTERMDTIMKAASVSNLKSIMGQFQQASDSYTNLSEKKLDDLYMLLSTPLNYIAHTLQEVEYETEEELFYMIMKAVDQWNIIKNDVPEFVKQLLEAREQHKQIALATQIRAAAAHSSYSSSEIN